MAYMLMLSRDLFQGSVVPFLTVKELSNLDIGVLDRQHRPMLLDLMSGLIIDQFTIKGDEISWLVSRKVSVRCLICMGGIGWFQLLSPSQISVLLRRCSHLTFQKYAYLNKEDIEGLVAYCPLLEVLRIQEIHPLHTNRKIVATSTGQVRSVAFWDSPSIDYCALLQSLHCTSPLMESISVEKEGPIPLVTIQKVVETLPRLTELKLVSVFHAVDPSAYDTFFALSSANTTLRSLTLHRYSKLYDVAVLSMIKTIPNLAYLNLSMCKRLTDVSVIAIAKGLHNLTELRLECIPSLTNASLIALGKHSPRLTTLFCDENENFTDRGVTRLAEGCTNMQIISLSGCIKLTPATYIAICVHCPAKRYVGLARIPDISCDDIDAIDDGTYR